MHFYLPIGISTRTIYQDHLISFHYYLYSRVLSSLDAIISIVATECSSWLLLLYDLDASSLISLPNSLFFWNSFWAFKNSVDIISVSSEPSWFTLNHVSLGLGDPSIDEQVKWTVWPSRRAWFSGRPEITGALGGSEMKIR